MKMYIILDQRIKELRERSGLTQTELAKKMGVTRSSVNGWEMGVSIPSIMKLVELAMLHKKTNPVFHQIRFVFFIYKCA